jgi:hypothetical protein
MLASEILNSVRRLIGDINSEKWSSSDVIDALNNSRTELIRNTAALKTRGTLYISAGENVHTIPNDCFFITRAVYGDKVVKFTTLSDIDVDKPYWLTDTADTELTLLIKDSVSKDTIMSYPILTNPADPYTITGDIGPITNISGVTLTGGSFGAITDIIDDEVDTIITREDEYGALTDINDAFITVTLYYIQKPIPITAETDESGFDSLYKMHLVYKTAAELLMYDENTENINKAVLFDSRADSHLESISEDVKLDYIVESDIHFKYNGGI